MRSLFWKIGLALLTFIIGIFLGFSNKSDETINLLSRIPEIEVVTPEHRGAESPFEDKVPVSFNDSEYNPPVRLIKNGGNFCEKYLLKKIVKEKSADSRPIKLRGFNPAAESLSPNVKEWLEDMHKDKLLAFEVQNNQQKALLLGSTSYGATGLATSLENWHIEINGVYSKTYWSFSENPNLVFWDKNGLLNYFSVVYSDDFLSATSSRDYDNLTVNIERYKISPDGKAQLVNKERNLQCK